ncbi:uncharacterized protein [Diadema antillarum]|uniref:uncharacterized protein n=1 Tax=Diadema antillarum TaxID=105358 RepID=UPI003A83F3A4
MYNDHKRIHSLKFQSVTATNGMIANLFGPIEGRRQDCFMLYRMSGLLAALEQRSHNSAGEVLCVYGDPAYPMRPHLQAPFKGNLTPDQQDYNKSMSSVRITVEWLFGDIVNFFKFVDFKKTQKVCLSTCGKMYAVCGLLTNAHTCLYGNNTSRFFGVEPPALEEYFQAGNYILRHRQCFVIVEKKAVPVQSLIDAVDTCYKARVLDCQYQNQLKGT